MWVLLRSNHAMHSGLHNHHSLPPCNPDEGGDHSRVGLGLLILPQKQSSVLGAPVFGACQLWVCYEILGNRYLHRCHDPFCYDCRRRDHLWGSSRDRSRPQPSSYSGGTRAAPRPNLGVVANY